MAQRPPWPLARLELLLEDWLTRFEALLAESRGAADASVAVPVAAPPAPHVAAHLAPTFGGPRGKAARAERAGIGHRTS